MEPDMCHIRICRDPIWILRGHNLSAPKVLMGETDSTLRCSWWWAAITYLEAQKPVEPDSGVVSESAFLQDQPQQERQPQNAWMGSIRIPNTKRRKKHERIWTSVRPWSWLRPRPDVSSVIVRHAHLWMCFILATETVAFLVSYLDTSGGNK
jgi:hypothetical protein